MKYAELIRGFFRSLFGSRYIAQLEIDLLAMRQEREYFKGRAERLEMMILQRPRLPEPYASASPEMVREGRKTLAQLQKELTEKELAEEKTSGVHN